MRIIFFGTSEFAVPALDALIKADHEITAVITQPDKSVGRKQVLSPSPIKVTAQKLKLKVLQPPSLKIDKLQNCLETKNGKLKIGIGIVASYGKIIPRELIDLPKYGMLNIHPSLLPKYRGPSPIQTAILNGDTKTGVSIILVDEKVDHGPIFAQQEWKFPISNLQFPNYKEAEQELAKLGAELLIDTLPQYINGEIKPQEQDHGKATFTKKFERSDGRIDWSQPGEKIYNQIRALNPEPGTWTNWQNLILNIKEVALSELPISNNQFPHKSKLLNGRVVKTVNKDIAVTTKTCYLVLKQIQLESGKVMDAKSFINGHPDFLGSRLE